jgi:hypothetical protein
MLNQQPQGGSIRSDPTVDGAVEALQAQPTAPARPRKQPKKVSLLDPRMRQFLDAGVLRQQRWTPMHWELALANGEDPTDPDSILMVGPSHWPRDGRAATDAARGWRGR